MRLFVAAYPPPEVCADLERRVASLNVARAAARGVNTRLARRDNWHVTLVFLGEVPDEQRLAVDTAVGAAVAQWCGGSAGPPVLRVAGGGRFGRGRFTILWADVRGDTEPLRRLGRELRQHLKRARLPYDDRPFKPHLTVARPGDRLGRDEVEADRAALGDYTGPPWRVDRIQLIRSHLGPSPTYDHLAAWPLA